MSARIVGKAFLWTITAAFATAVLFVAVGVSIPVIGTLIGSGSPSAWAVWGFWTALRAVIPVVAVQLPLVLITGIIWIALVRQQPHLDQTRRGFLVGCLIVSLPGTLITWIPNRAVWLPDPTTAPAFPTTVTALIVIVFNYLGVLLPRLIVPGLKQSQLVPPLGDTDQEPAR